MNMRVLHDAEGILRGAGYTVQLRPEDGALLYFEDYSLVGFVAVFGTTSALIGDWRLHQDAFLRRHSVRLRRDPTKSWNVYSILLTDDAATESERRAITQIEEDFASTRKIARSTLTTRADVGRALLPLLPIAALGGSESSNPDLALITKLDAAERELFSMLRNDSTDATRVLSWLMTESV
jgi:hypothetical protein